MQDLNIGAWIKAVDFILKLGNNHAMKTLPKVILALAAASLIGLAYAAAQPEAVIHIGHEKWTPLSPRGDC